MAEFRGCNVAVREVTDPEYETSVKYSISGRGVFPQAEDEVTDTEYVTQVKYSTC